MLDITTPPLLAVSAALVPPALNGTIPPGGLNEVSCSARQPVADIDGGTCVNVHTVFADKTPRETAEALKNVTDCDVAAIVTRIPSPRFSAPGTPTTGKVMLNPGDGILT